MKNINRVTLDTSVTDAIVAMSGGNPGALTVLMQLMSTELGLIGMCHLDDREIYGSDIWVAWKDICKEDMNLFVATIRDRSNDLEDKIEAIQHPNSGV